MFFYSYFDYFFYFRELKCTKNDNTRSNIAITT